MDTFYASVFLNMLDHLSADHIDISNVSSNVGGKSAIPKPYQSCALLVFVVLLQALCGNMDNIFLENAPILYE